MTDSRRTPRLLPLAATTAALVLGMSLPASADPVDAATTPPASSAVFVPSSTSWADADDGWVLGFTCPDGPCSRLISTGDGGASWTELTPPPLAVDAEWEKHERVVRLGDRPRQRDAALATDGYELHVTRDGAESWSTVELPDVGENVQIGSIAATKRRIYVVVGDGMYEEGRTRLFSSPIGRDRWRPVAGLEVPGNGVVAGGGWDVGVKRTHVAVALGQVFTSNRYWTSDDAGRTWTERDTPCGVEWATSFGRVGKHRVDVMCSRPGGQPGHSLKELRTSVDDGPFTDVASAPEAGIAQEYAVAGRVKVITSVAGASILYVQRHGGEWRTPIFDPDALPFVDLSMSNRRTGHVLWGGTGWGDAVVYATDDRGRSWLPLTLG